MKPIIGAHVSAAGGIEKAVERASLLGCNALQLFSGSPRSWKRNELKKNDVEKMISKRKELVVEKVFTHSLYLINLASDKEDLLRKSFGAIKYDLEFDAHIAGSGIVVHLGSHLGKGFEAVKNQIVEQIHQALLTTNGGTFLIENSAGQEGKIASELTEVQWLLKALEQKGQWLSKARLGWCMDTCHAFAAGYSLQTPEFLEKDTKSVISEIDNLELWDSLKCIHVNDSKKPFNSGADRHENLGEGEIPLEDFIGFVNYPKVTNIPLVLEVPGEGNGPDKKNVERLKGWVET